MAVARPLAAVALALALAGPAAAQTYPLAEAPPANDCFRLRLTMKLSGELVVVQDGKPTSLKLTAAAEHRYRERVLAVAVAGGLPAKAARVYDEARATITVDGAASERTLRPDRRLA